MNTETERIVEQIERLPEELQQEVLDFIQFLQHRAVQRSESVLLSEEALAKDWLTPEEDAGWQDL
ncbi:MAG: DUF2281 domain-containing protein [Salinibacter sp.]